VAEVVQRLGRRVDPSAVADRVGVDPVLVDIAVENLAPITAAGKADSIVEAIEIPEVHDHDHVVAFSPQPSGEMRARDSDRGHAPRGNLGRASPDSASEV